jgi:RND superfamily putative drug exporter
VGTVIAGAAIIMIAVFISFGIGGLRIIEEFGTGLACAVLFDAFLIRATLVPAVMQIPGRVNWLLPRWLNWLPMLRIEAVAMADAPVGDTAPPVPTASRSDKP